MGQHRGRYLMKNTFVFAIGNFGTKIIAFFLVPLYTNVLTVSDYGTVDLIYTIGTVLLPLLTMNIAEAIMRFSLDDMAEHNAIMSTGMVLFSLATAMGLFLFPIGKCFRDISPYLIYLYFYIITMAFDQIVLCYLRGKEMLLQYSFGNIIQTLSIAVFNIIFLLIMNKGIKGYFLAYIIAHCISATYAFIVGDVFKVLRNFRINKALSRSMIKYSAYLIPNSFMWWIMNSADRIMVTTMIGVAANGVYAIAYKLPTLLSTFTHTFNVAWSYSAIRENESKDNQEYNNMIYDKLVSFVVIIAAGLLMIMKFFLRYYVEDSYYNAWRYTPYLTIGFVFMTLGSFVATQYTVHKDSRGMLKSALCGAFVNIILNGVFIGKIGVAGAAIATAISYMTVFLYRVYDTRKYIRLNVLKKKHIGGYILLAIMSFTMFLENDIEQLILFLEFICVIVINRKCFIGLFEMAKRKLMKV